LPNNLSFVFFVLLELFFCVTIILFIFSIDSKYVLAFFHLRLWFVPFDPW
jgi:hypothetical protein